MSTSEKGIVMNVYDVIKSLCDERGLAVTALEKELGFGRGSIGKLKKGGSTTADRLQRIGDYFGVSTEYLLTGTPSDTHIDPDMQFIMSTWKILNDDDRNEIMTLLRIKYEKYRVKANVS